MSEIPTPNAMPGATPAASEPPVEAVTPPLEEAPAAKPTADPAPPWGDDDFDPDKAWKLVQNLRSEAAALKAKAAEAQPLLEAAEKARRQEQGELETLREDYQKALEWRQEAVRSKAEAIAAAAKFNDPSDAITMIGDLSGYIDGNAIDAQRLSERITALASEKPYLLAQPAQQGLTPNRGQGQSGTGPTPVDAQIKAAQERGDVMTSIALKQQKYYSTTSPRS